MEHLPVTKIRKYMSYFFPNLRKKLNVTRKRQDLSVFCQKLYICDEVNNSMMLIKNSNIKYIKKINIQ